MTEQYRIPTIDEFKQGFKFEWLRFKKGTHLGGMIMFDFSNNETTSSKDIYAEEDIWEEVVVYWDKEPEMITRKFEDGTAWTLMENPQFDWYPWTNEGYIQELINDKKVRVKI